MKTLIYVFCVLICGALFVAPKPKPVQEPAKSVTIDRINVMQDAVNVREIALNDTNVTNSDTFFLDSDPDVYLIFKENPENLKQAENSLTPAENSQEYDLKVSKNLKYLKSRSKELDQVIKEHKTE